MIRQIIIYSLYHYNWQLAFLHKKDKKFHPVSLLPLISKLFETNTSDQIVT